MNARFLFAVLVSLLGFSSAANADWPQWRGANRDAKVSDFKAPATWPKELKQAWKVMVGDGVATPALVGDKLYVFSREGANEVIRCLDAATGGEVWLDKYEARPADGPAGSYPGPRSSPTVANGKVLTLGARGILCCRDAATGKELWRNDTAAAALPRFYTSCSPLVVDGQCIVQVGGENQGAVAAYDLATGDEKWKWTGDGTAYSSPVLMNLDGEKFLVAETASKIVAISLADRMLLWETPFAVTGRGYNAATPIVDGSMVFYTGSNRGTTAVKIEKKGAELTASELWTSPDSSVQYNTPVLKDGFLYGLTQGNEFFCISAKDGKTAWRTPAAGAATAAPAAPAGGDKGKGKGRRGGGGGGYGSIVDAGSVLLALTPASELIVIKPASEAYTELARYKVADSPTHAYPIAADNRIFVKDRDSVMLWTLE